MYLRNSNTTGQPTDSIILARCKRRGSQQESLTRASSRLAFHASTHQPDASATRSFLNRCRDYPHRFVTTARHRLMYFSFLRQRVSDTRELPPPACTYVRDDSPPASNPLREHFSAEASEKSPLSSGRINCQTRNNLNAAREQISRNPGSRRLLKPVLATRFFFFVVRSLARSLHDRFND